MWSRQSGEMCRTLSPWEITESCLIPSPVVVVIKYFTLGGSIAVGRNRKGNSGLMRQTGFCEQQAVMRKRYHALLLLLFNLFSMLVLPFLSHSERMYWTDILHEKEQNGSRYQPLLLLLSNLVLYLFFLWRGRNRKVILTACAELVLRVK